MLLIPAPDRGDVAAYRGLVQAEAELAVGGGLPGAARCGSCSDPSRRRDARDARDARDNSIAPGHALIAALCAGHCQEQVARLCSAPMLTGVRDHPLTRIIRQSGNPRSDSLSWLPSMKNLSRGRVREALRVCAGACRCQRRSSGGALHVDTSGASSRYGACPRPGGVPGGDRRG